jgi:hypothetical protein
VTFSEGCRAARTELAGIFPGSWIDANFYIWIGHPDDHRAWSQLAEARAMLDVPGPGRADDAAMDRAREEILIAEGSDWFWWYGDDHSSEHDAEFDELFRRHLRNVYRLLQRPVPDDLFASNISAGAAPPAATGPTALIAPTLDGEETSYFEWLGAGHVEVRETPGAMHQIDRQPPLLTAIWFGFGQDHLFVRLDAVRPMQEILADGHDIALCFLMPEGLRLRVRAEAGARGLVSTAGTILEVAVPLATLGSPRRIAFFVAVETAQGVERERHPSGHPLEIERLDAGFEASNWTA